MPSSSGFCTGWAKISNRRPSPENDCHLIICFGYWWNEEDDRTSQAQITG
jgi:hypothetical protein